jgi:hypothetical protein
VSKLNSCRYDIELLRKLWAAGETCSTIAAALGCSQSYVMNVRLRLKLPARRRQKTAKELTADEIYAAAYEIRKSRSRPEDCDTEGWTPPQFLVHSRVSCRTGQKHEHAIWRVV